MKNWPGFKSDGLMLRWKPVSYYTTWFRPPNWWYSG